jgi:Flp pilus assembly pilin Flp
MARKWSLSEFVKDDQGVIPVEYMIFVATIAIILSVGVAALMGGMSSYFNSWADFFRSTTS